MGIGVWELAIILIIVLVLFGVGRLPELGAGIGKMVRGFKDELERKEAAQKEGDKEGKRD